MINDTIGFNSAYISLNLLDELDFYMGGYGKPNIEFLFTLNTFVESFIASSAFYTSLDELNHLSLTAQALFPNGRPILNLVAREGGLRFVKGVIDKPGIEIYRADASGRSRKEAQQDFVIEHGKKIQERYLITSSIDNLIEKIPLVTSKFDDEDFVVSEVLSTSTELVSNLLNVSRSSSIQTTLPIYLYERQIGSLSKTPYSIQALDALARLHEANFEELKRSLNFQYFPIPPFTNILLSQVTSVSDIPQKLTQLRADFQDLRTKFVELETEIHDSDRNLKQQMEAFRKFKEFWSAFNRKYIDKKTRILYGTTDIFQGGDVDKTVDSLFDGATFTDSIKDLNLGKVAGNLLTKGYSWFNEKRIINRFKGLTNIWELFLDSKGIIQQITHVERLFSVKFSNQEINRVHSFVKNGITDITEKITKS